MLTICKPLTAADPGALLTLKHACKGLYVSNVRPALTSIAGQHV